MAAEDFDTIESELEMAERTLKNLVETRPKSVASYYAQALTEVRVTLGKVKRFAREAARRERNAGAAKIVEGMERKAYHPDTDPSGLTHVEQALGLHREQPGEGHG